MSAVRAASSPSRARSGSRALAREMPGRRDGVVAAADDEHQPVAVHASEQIQARPPGEGAELVNEALGLGAPGGPDDHGHRAEGPAQGRGPGLKALVDLAADERV